jgi:hypothetical protein
MLQVDSVMTRQIEGCETEEAFYEAAVLAETQNQIIKNEAITLEPIYAAASAAAYDAMLACWAGGPSG